MIYTLRFFPLQNAVCFVILAYLVPVLFTFYMQCVPNLKKNNSGAKRVNKSKSFFCILRFFSSKITSLQRKPLCKRYYSYNEAEFCNYLFIFFVFIQLQGLVLFRRMFLPKFYGSRTEMLVHVTPAAGLGVTVNYNLDHFHGSFRTRNGEQLKPGVHCLGLKYCSLFNLYGLLEGADGGSDRAEELYGY